MEFQALVPQVTIDTFQEKETFSFCCLFRASSMIMPLRQLLFEHFAKLSLVVHKAPNAQKYHFRSFQQTPNKVTNCVQSLFRIRILDLIARSNLQRRMTQPFYLILSFSPIYHLQCPRCLLTSFQHLLLSTLTLIIVCANLPKLGIISHFRCVTIKRFCNLVLVMPLQQSILVSNDHYHIHYSSNNIIIY